MRKCATSSPNCCSGSGQAVNFVAGEEVAHRLLGFDPDPDKYNPIGWPEATAKDFPLDVSKWQILEIFDQLYDFADRAVARVGVRDMCDESVFTYCAAFVYDIGRSHLLHEFHGSGGEYVSSRRCEQVVALANARLALNDSERFFQTPGNDTSDGALTIREMALLSGMTEPSVRNAANPKTANPLVTYQDGRSTYVSLEAAAAWLKSKVKYLEITSALDAGDASVLNRPFESEGDLETYFDSRRANIGVTAERIVDACGPVIARAVEELDLGTLCAANDEGMRALGKLLEADPALLTLRLKEFHLKRLARSIQKEIQQLFEMSTPER